MRTINIIDICGQLLNRIFSGAKSPDRTTEYFFREKRKLIGSKERKFISNAVFTTIRNYLLLKDIESQFNIKDKLNHPKIFSNAYSHSVLILLQIILKEKFPDDFSELDLSFIYYDNADNIIDVIENDLSIIQKSELFLKNLKSITTDITAFYSNLKCKYYANSSLNDTINYVIKRFSFENEFIELLLKNPQINQNNILNFVDAMNKNADTCLRVNTSLISREDCINLLTNANIECKASNISPTGIIINGRHQLTTLDIYNKGYFTIQDIASQMVAFIANPKPNDAILDACAGAGGKSLHIADLQHNQGKIIASDVEFIKIKEITKRAKLSGFNSIIPALWDSNNNYLPFTKASKYIKQQNKFDIVIVDTPCSGSGTIRRNPIRKYRITQKTITKIKKRQKEIINTYSKFVKPGGTLIYSTCSVFTQENEQIVEKFLNENKNFKATPIKPALAEWNINIDINDNAHTLSLFPHKQQTDGFFIAKMVRLD